MFRKLYKIYPKKLFILHTSKTDGDYELIEIKNISKTIRWAKKVVEVSVGVDLLQEERKKKSIII